MPKRASLGGTILGGSGGMLPKKSLKIKCLRLAKNAFAIQHSI